MIMLKGRVPASLASTVEESSSHNSTSTLDGTNHSALPNGRASSLEPSATDIDGTTTPHCDALSSTADKERKTKREKPVSPSPYLNWPKPWPKSHLCQCPHWIALPADDKQILGPLWNLFKHQDAPTARQVTFCRSKDDDFEFASLSECLCICRFSENHPSLQVIAYLRGCLHLEDRELEHISWLGKTQISAYLDFLVGNANDADGSLASLTRRWVRKVACATGVLPTSLFIEGVKRESEEEVAFGGSASIYKGSFAKRPVALKVLRHIPNDKSFNKEFCLEALVWHQLNSPRILPLLGVNKTLFSPRIALISPWMPYGNILEYLKGRPTMVPDKLLHQAAQGIDYLHSLCPPLVHGDVKAVNMLVNEHQEICVADFGLISVSETYMHTFATAADSRSSEIGGTVRWMAPELHTSDIIKSRQADIYAFGMMMIEVFTGLVPFHHLKKDSQVLLAVMRGELPTRPDVGKTRGLTDSFWSLMMHCWKKQGDRPTSEHLKESLMSFLLPSDPELIEVSASIDDSTDREKLSQHRRKTVPVSLPTPVPSARRSLKAMLSQHGFRRSSLRPFQRESIIRSRNVHSHNVRVGWYNSYGDQLWTNEGSYVAPPRGEEYPPDLASYPVRGKGWMNENGRVIDIHHRLLRDGW